MPLPTPTQNENRAQFISRCMSNDTMQQEYPDNDQRLAVCGSQYDRSQERDMNANNKLLKAIQARAQKQEPFAYGIWTADKYVRTMQERVGPTACHQTMKRFTRSSFDDALTKAAVTLTYTNPNMVLEAVEYERKAGDVKQLDDGIDMPKNTLMAFRHVLTTPRVDRDGDILRTEGADVDPHMLLLWQHVHTLPIGKVLSVPEHTKDRLVLVSAIVDMNELCHDAAVMIDNKMGRFSHGFRALEFEEIKENDKDALPSGFDVKRFEIMEDSLVSIPSNVDAETEEVLLYLVDGGKLTSCMMKELGKTIREKRPIAMPVKLELELSDESKKTLKEIQDANESGNGSDAAEKGRAGSGSPKETDEDGTKDKAKEAGASEVKRLGGPLDGSWEHIGEKLRTDAKQFLAANGVSVGEHDWIWLVGTFPDHTIICLEKSESGARDEYRYYKALWEMSKGEPLYKGDLEQVDFTTTIHVQERSPAYSMKSEKRGRSLSKANEVTIQDAKENIDEVVGMDIPRTAKATLREASRGLGTVLDAIGIDEQESSAESITVEKGLKVILTCGTDHQLVNVGKAIDAEVKNRKNKKKTKQFRAFKGNG